jgi:hypothetical protein
MPKMMRARPSRADGHENQPGLANLRVLEYRRGRRPSGAPGFGAHRPCGHHRHVGTCPACQRAQLARWSSQLVAASS